ncbi:MAG: glycosyltransferase [Bacteroidales bacterium]
MNKGISIIVCCYNSALRLPETIKHIAGQLVNSDIKWEVIIVNNASNDNTVEIANAEWNKYNCTANFTIVDQPIPGLSAAREKGIEISAFEYVIFCDDDNWLNENYVSIAYESMEYHSDAGIIGGQTEGFFEKEKPYWFDLFAASYVIEQPYSNSCYLTEDRDYLAGAGLVVRKSIFKILNKLNFSQILTDRIGNSLMSGGDYELCLITKFLGFRIYYDENLKLTHYMPADRLNWNYCLKMITYGHAIPEIYFRSYKVIFSKKINGFSFNRYYKKLLISYLFEICMPERYRLRSIIKVIIQMKYFFKLFPGSMEQKRLLSAKNKLIYLLLNKNKFKVKLLIMNILIEKIKKYKDLNNILE